MQGTAISTPFISARSSGLPKHIHLLGEFEARFHGRGYWSALRHVEAFQKVNNNVLVLGEGEGALGSVLGGHMWTPRKAGEAKVATFECFGQPGLEPPDFFAELDTAVRSSTNTSTINLIPSASQT